MKHILLALTALLFILCSNAFAGEKHKPASTNTPPLQCAAFSPYVGDLNPDYGPGPSKQLIAQLLDTLVKETRFRCIMTYGVLNGLDETFAAAKARNIKVIAIIWLDKDRTVNSQSISKGIEVARTYADTIIKLSCGSEVRTRHGHAFDSEIMRCIDAFHEAKVSQPITTIDTWWEWCDRSSSCKPTIFAKKVDWIGTNIFPWWENKFSAKTCTPAAKAADYEIARLTELHHTYPGKDIIMTEFGWPNGPAGESEYNPQTKARCGVASPENQKHVVQSTFKKLAQKKWSGTVFQAFSEKWKTTHEGHFGANWGICQGEPPYTCAKGL